MRRQGGEVKATKKSSSEVDVSPPADWSPGALLGVIHAQMPAVVGALLALEGLRRVPGRKGRILYDGSYPDRLVLRFNSSTVESPE